MRAKADRGERENGKTRESSDSAEGVERAETGRREGGEVGGIRSRLGA